MNLYDTWGGTVKISHLAYEKYIEDNQALRRYFNRWVEQGYTLTYEDYQKLFANIYKKTKIVKYRDFEYRLLLGKIVTNKELYEWKIKDNANCSFCNLEIDSLLHLFKNCTIVKDIYNLLIYWMDEKQSVDPKRTRFCVR